MEIPAANRTGPFNLNQRLVMADPIATYVNPQSDSSTTLPK